MREKNKQEKNKQQKGHILGFGGQTPKSADPFAKAKLVSAKGRGVF